MQGIGGVQDGGLLAADASSPSDVWAVGASNHLSPTQLGLALRWDGNRWVRVDVTGVDALYDVTVIGPRDAWAIGPRGPEDDYWLGHWDGTDWSAVQPPPRWTHVLPSAIEAVAADDVWLVGTDYGTETRAAPYIAHWDGQRWSLSEVNRPSGLLEDISAFSADSVWAVGYASLDEYDQETGTVVLRWDGEDWLEISTPAGIDGLDNITATGRDEAWGVPDYYVGERSPLWRWDGGTWRNEVSPLYEISALSSSDGVLWAAGSHPSSVAIARLGDDEWEQASMTGARSLDAEDPFPGFVAVSETTAWGVGREPVASRACIG